MTGRSMPDRIALNLRLPRGEDGYWAVIRSLDSEGAWSTTDVDQGSCDRRGCVDRYVRKLVKAGFARMISDIGRRGQKTTPRTYRLTKKPKDAPRIRPDGSVIPSTRQECMWRAMRSLRQGFTARDLAFTASLPEQSTTEDAARFYIELLFGAGYLVLVRERVGRHGLRTWRLKPAMNTGPLSPTIYKSEAVFDRNLRRVMSDPADAKEVA